MYMYMYMHVCLVIDVLYMYIYVHVHVYMYMYQMCIVSVQFQHCMKCMINCKHRKKKKGRIEQWKQNILYTCTSIHSICNILYMYPVYVYTIAL